MARDPDVPAMPPLAPYRLTQTLGVDNLVDSSRVPPGFVYDCENLRHDRSASRVRTGFTTPSTWEDFSDTALTGIHSWRGDLPSTTTRREQLLAVGTLAATNTTKDVLFSNTLTTALPDGLGFTPVSGASLTATQADTFFAAFDRRVYGVNAKDGLFSWDGSAFVKYARLPTPTTVPATGGSEVVFDSQAFSSTLNPLLHQAYASSDATKLVVSLDTSTTSPFANVATKLSTTAAAGATAGASAAGARAYMVLPATLDLSSANPYLYAQSILVAMQSTLANATILRAYLVTDTVLLATVQTGTPDATNWFSLGNLSTGDATNIYVRRLSVENCPADLLSHAKYLVLEVADAGYSGGSGWTAYIGVTAADGFVANGGVGTLTYYKFISRTTAGARSPVSASTSVALSYYADGLTGAGLTGTHGSPFTKPRFRVNWAATDMAGADFLDVYRAQIDPANNTTAFDPNALSYFKVGAAAKSAKGIVTGFTVTAAGAAYATAPAVTLTGGGGTGAKAAAILVAGGVLAVVVLHPGTGYTSAPTVTFASGAAAATALIGADLTSFNDNLDELGLISDPINHPGLHDTAPPPGTGDDAPRYILSTGTRLVVGGTRNNPARMFVSNLNTTTDDTQVAGFPNVLFTDLDPDNDVGIGGFADVGLDYSDDIMGFSRRLNENIVFKRSGVWAFNIRSEGAADEHWYVDQLVRAPGLVSPRGHCRTPEGIFYASYDGLYFLRDGTEYAALASHKIQAWYDAIPAPLKAKIVCAYHPVERIVVVGIAEAGGARNSTVAVCDLRVKDPATETSGDAYFTPALWCWAGRWRIADGGTAVLPGLLFCDRQDDGSVHLYLARADSPPLDRQLLPTEANAWKDYGGTISYLLAPGWQEPAPGRRVKVMRRRLDFLTDGTAGKTGTAAATLTLQARGVSSTVPNTVTHVYPVYMEDLATDTDGLHSYAGEVERGAQGDLKGEAFRVRVEGTMSGNEEVRLGLVEAQFLDAGVP